MKKIIFLSVLVLLGCDSTISNDSSPEEVIEVLTQNYNHNKESFAEMIEYYKENGELTREQTMLCFGDSIPLEYETACNLHEITRTYLATNNNNSWFFPTFDNRKDGFLYDYFYLYNESNEVLPECKVEEPDKRSKSSTCYIPLNKDWYIGFSYFAIENNFPG